MARQNNRMKNSYEEAAGSSFNLFHTGGGFFEIHVIGQLDSRWSEWLEGLDMNLLENGEMILFGPIVDQAALMGILNKLSLLNLTLISVNKVSRKTEKETE